MVMVAIPKIVTKYHQQFIERSETFWCLTHFSIGKGWLKRLAVLVTHLEGEEVS